MASERRNLEKKLDTLTSFIVRCRDDWRCVYTGCGVQYLPPTKSLQCSHFFHRVDRGTRWDFKNCDALCYGHHRLVEGDKQRWYKQFKIKQLGEKEFELLEIRASSITKFSTSDLKLLLYDYGRIAERARQEFKARHGRLPEARP